MEQPTAPPRRGTIAAVVLAAGSGTRFAGRTHKLLADVKGVPLVRRAVDAARGAELDETIVVIGATDLLGVLPHDVTVVRNDHWEDGQGSSLQVAVAYAGSVGHRAVVVGLGDQPGVPVAAWRAVAEEDHDLVVASFGGRRRPPTRIGSALWAQLPVSGDEGARVLMRRRPELLRAVACEGDPDDIDTVEDLARWS
ncbi:MAG: NTP transferase domain-containing protein [Acidimicrobiales bacterium]